MMSLNYQIVLILCQNIQDSIEHIIKEYEILAAISPIHVYINRINARLIFKIKDGYKPE